MRQERQEERRKGEALMSGKRERPPTTRNGITHEIKVGSAKAYITLNYKADNKTPCEIFVTLNQTGKKSSVDSAHQGWANLSLTFASLLMQYGCPLGVIANKMKGYRFEPDGGFGGPLSIPDAIGKWLETQLPGGVG